MDKWKMYMNIKQLHKQGFKVSEIARKLDISRTTVYEYLNRSPEEMGVWVASTKQRKKKLDPYHQLILSWLQEHPDLSASQIQDWLLERYPSLKVGESTVRAYVREMREKYHIPKTQTKRVYQAIPDPPMGQQAQVDFGETTQKTTADKSIKLYFISFVLSHSRYKYAEWLDRPFTTRDVIRAHERAFQHFQGMPYEMVYDQDALLVVNENAGDIMLTAEFQAYREQRGFTLYVCRKADPESKGKIENVVGFIKHNFAKHRIFHNTAQWNEQCQAWLERTGNGKVHHTTKKRPVDVFRQEHAHLRPVSHKIKIASNTLSIARTVRKDNTILYLSNRYSVPLGTYEKDKYVYLTVTEEDRLQIREEEDGSVIAEHPLSQGKGKLIQQTQHTRDRTKGIAAYIRHVAEQFPQVEQAHTYLKEMHTRYPRYIRDQLQLMLKAMKDEKAATLDEALQTCLTRKLYSATEFSDVVQYVKRQRQVNTSLVQEKNQREWDHPNPVVAQTQPEKRGMDAYVAILKGESV